MFLADDHAPPDMRCWWSRWSAVPFFWPWSSRACKHLSTCGLCKCRLERTRRPSHCNQDASGARRLPCSCPDNNLPRGRNLNKLTRRWKEDSHHWLCLLRKQRYLGQFELNQFIYFLLCPRKLAFFCNIHRATENKWNTLSQDLVFAKLTLYLSHLGMSSQSWLSFDCNPQSSPS